MKPHHSFRMERMFLWLIHVQIYCRHISAGLFLCVWLVKGKVHSNEENIEVKEYFFFKKKRKIHERKRGHRSSLCLSEGTWVHVTQEG